MLELAGDAISLEEAAQTPNVAEVLPDSDLTRIGAHLTKMVELDEGSREEWMEKAEDGLKLFMQSRAEEKNYPFENASNVIYPLLTTSVIQFAARVMPAIVPGPLILQCKVVGDDTEQYKIPDGAQVIGTDGDTPLIAGPDGQPQPAPMVKPAGTKAARGRRVAEHMSWQFLHQMPSWKEDTDQMMHYIAAAGCAFRKMYYDREEKRPATEWVRGGDFICSNATKSLKDCPRYAQVLTYYPHEVKEKMRSGQWLEYGDEELFTDGNDDDAPIEVLEVYCRLDLDQDGYPEPYMVTVDRKTGKVFHAALNAHPEKQPRMGQDGRITYIEPNCYFVKYGFVPDPDKGFYDVGFGWLLGGINKVVNTTINQMIDAGHWQNSMQGFVGKGLRTEGGEITLAPNEYKMVDVRGEDLRTQIYEIQHPGPSSVMFSMLGLMIEAGQDISSVKDIMVGDAQANLAPGTIATLVEQGMKQFQAIFARVHRSFTKEAGLLFDLNRLTLLDHMASYGEVLDDPEAVGPEDYALNYDIYPVTDPTQVSDQAKLAKAQFVFQLAQQGVVDIKEATRRLLEAAGIDDTEALTEFEPAPNPELEFRNKELQMRLMELSMKMMEMDNAALEKFTKAAKNLSDIVKDGVDVSSIVNLTAALDAREEMAPQQQ